MALIPIISKVAIGVLAKSMTLRDATGAYNVSTNPGGYGTPNIDSPPATIGLTWREWESQAYNYQLVSSDTVLIAELVSGTGHKFLNTDLGITAFGEGVQHIKYYPFIAVATSNVFTYDQTLKTFTRTSGTFDPTVQSAENYVAVLTINEVAGTINSGILLLGDTADWTSTTFTIIDDWTNTGEANQFIMLATEADLKLLIAENTKACIATKVGKLAKMECCNHVVVDKLVELSMWVFSADVKLQCQNYQGANDLILAAYNECTHCISNDCTTCNS